MAIKIVKKIKSEDEKNHYHCSKVGCFKIIFFYKYSKTSTHNTFFCKECMLENEIVDYVIEEEAGK